MKTIEITSKRSGSSVNAFRSGEEGWRSVFLLIAVAVGFSGCGTMPTDRGLSGMGLGAGAGAVIAAVADTSILTGAALGAVAGGVAGLLTDPDRVNLGRPIWAKSRTGSNVARSGPSDGTAHGASAESRTRVRSIQAGLAQLGYDPGPADGILGPRTKRAIQSYQEQRGLPVDGRPSARLVADIQERLGAKPQMAGI